MKPVLLLLVALVMATPLAWTRAEDKPAEPPARPPANPPALPPADPPAAPRKPANTPRATDRGDLSKPHDDPVDSYLVMDIEGWVVRVSKRYEPHDELRRRVLDEVRAQLRRITLIVNEPQLADLRKTEIWVEHDYPGRCQYHPDRGWLLNNGYVAQKHKTVEIASASGFLDWQARPVMTLLHELCHAYHDRVLGFDEPRIKALHEAAIKSGKFDKVIRDHGRSDRHYGLTTRQEYFAEASEAYLWVNDYYPFVYGELREADPEMAKLLEQIWGKRR